MDRVSTVDKFALPIFSDPFINPESNEPGTASEVMDFSLLFFKFMNWVVEIINNINNIKTDKILNFFM